YYGWVKNSLIFASELKAIQAHPDFTGQVDRGALALFLRFGCIPQPHSIYRGIRKLPPGCVVSLKPRAARVPGSELVQTYWSMTGVAQHAAQSPFKGTPQEAAGELERLLRDAIRLRMVADVPLGAFLSGGIDSSAVVALMQAESSRPVKTFTIGFHDDDFNEAVHAKTVASHLGTEHTEAYITAEEALAVVPQLPVYYDEPFADASQIPTYLVSRMARRHVTVTLSGDGGDELFGGYDRYTIGPRLWRMLRPAPHRLRRGAANLAHAFLGFSDDSPSNIRGESPGVSRLEELRRKRERIQGLLGAKRLEDLYFATFSHGEDPAKLVEGYEPSATVLDGPAWFGAVHGTAQRLMFFDTVFYLPDDILVKLDRASMAVGLESRVPLLDHRVVEFAARLPVSLKIREGRTKWLLRKVLEPYVPPKLTERPKRGFSIPLGAWLRGPLRDWAEALLSETRLRHEGFFRPIPVRRVWQAHLAGRTEGQYQLWDLLMFQAWWEHRSKNQDLTTASAAVSDGQRE
ncbi:MAG: asparagine synthase (glutamine-hydrolyzing), partial [Terriglobia bacterium]